MLLIDFTLNFVLLTVIIIWGEKLFCQSKIIYNITPFAMFEHHIKLQTKWLANFVIIYSPSFVPNLYGFLYTVEKKKTFEKDIYKKSLFSVHAIKVEGVRFWTKHVQKQLKNS